MKKGSSMNFMIGLAIALFMFGIIVTLTTSSILEAQSASQGCGPLASVIADISEGAIQPC